MVEYEPAPLQRISPSQSSASLVALGGAAERASSSARGSPDAAGGGAGASPVVVDAGRKDATFSAGRPSAAPAGVAAVARLQTSMP